MNVIVNGLAVNYQKFGKGRALVLLHGWGDTGMTYSKLVEQLQDKYEVLVLDLPGFGGTQPPPNAWGLEDYADFVRDWTAKIGAKPFGIVGHSYGGAVAIKGAKDLGAEKMVLIASAGIRNKKAFRKKLLQAAAKTAKVPLYLLPSAKRLAVKEKLYRAAGSDLMLVPHMELTFRRIINDDIRDAAARIKIPTLLIYGTKDKDTPKGDGQLLKRTIPHSRLEILEGGHFIHQEHPHQVALIIDDFLNGEPNA